MKSLFASIAILVLSIGLSEEMNPGSSVQKLVRRNMTTFRFTIFREIFKACNMLYNLLFECLDILGPKEVSCLKWSFTAKNPL